MLTQEFCYDLPGCAEGCAHRLPDTRGARDHGYVSVNMGYHGHLTTIEVVPHCARQSERVERRKRIFDAANKAVEHAGDHCASLRSKLRAEQEAFDAEARKWWDGPCPLYEATDD